MNTVQSFEDLDPAVRDDVEGLAHLGELTESVAFCGHTFVLKTLTLAEEIAASNAAKEYRDSLKEPEAVAASQVALALVSIDGNEDFCPPIGPDLNGFAQARFDWVTKQWYWPTIEFLFRNYIALNERQLRAIDGIQDLSSGNLPPSSPSVDSLIVPGNSPDEIDSEPQP